MKTITKKKLDNELDKPLVTFTPSAWEEYEYWLKNNPVKCQKINDLIAASQVSLHTGIGKPEKLSGNLKGYYSRRIDLEHRLVYKGDGKNLIILSAQFHY